MYKLSLLGLGLIFFFSSCTDGKKVSWVSSSGNIFWQHEPPIEFSNQKDKSDAIMVNTRNTKQSIEGFGGCFNEMGWEAIQVVSDETKSKIFKDIFDINEGCRFNIYRMPMGANDYAVDWYSHNETPEDYEMTNFNIERDKLRLIPYIKAAKQINPNFTLWASPWCPPSWMKTNGHYACKPNPRVNDLPEDKAGEEMVTQFRMEDQVLDAYALYFSKFLSSYKDEDIDIAAVHVQNEPNSCQNFPSCVWRPEDLATFIGKHLGPKLKHDHPEVELWLGTIERPQIERVDSILQNKDASQYVKGVGFQWAGKGAIPEVHKKYPHMRLMQTETECGDGSNDWKAASYTFDLMHHYFMNGANAYLYWNMILDETGSSQWGWQQNSMITIDRNTGKAVYNPEFYLMKHFSYFVAPGSHYIELEGNNKNTVAFKNDEEVVIIYHNKEGQPKNVQFAVDDRSFDVEVQGMSLNTFTIEL